MGSGLACRGDGFAAVAVVGGTGAFGGDHGGAEGVLGGAAGAEGGAFVGLDFALQYQAAEAFGRFLDAEAGDTEFALGVEGGVGGTEAEAALGDFADAPPFARGDLEDLVDELLGGAIASAADGAGVLVFDFGPAGFQLLDAHEHALQDVKGLKPRHHYGHMILCGDGEIFLEAHDGADVAGGEEALHAAVGSAEDGLDGRAAPARVRRAGRSS